MKTLILAAIRCSLMFAVPTLTYAISAQWDLDPISGDWNTAANWTPDGVPSGPADTATFGLSNTTNVSISADIEVNGITFTAAATNPYTIRVGALPRFLRLVLSGAGITNNSGTMQEFVTIGGAMHESPVTILFTNSATAGSNITFTNIGGAGFQSDGQTVFFGTASAGNATFVNRGGPVAGGGDGVTSFLDSSTAANGTFINEGGLELAIGVTEFFSPSTTAANGTFINNGGTFNGALGGATLLDSTGANAVFTNNGASASGAFGGVTGIEGVGTAGNAIITNNGATVSGAGGGQTFFSQFGTAGNSIITNNGATVRGAGGGQTLFSQFGTAGNSIITNNGATVSGAGGGQTLFRDNATAESAILIANAGSNGGQGGTILFAGQSTAGTARIEIFGNGSLDISPHDAPGMTINSIEGDGIVFLGANNLTVGSDNLNTTFACAIQDGGQGGGVGGPLTKIGSGTLILSGANTYTGNTNVNRGVLQVDGSIKSNTTVHGRSALAGTGTINGNVTNNVRVSPGKGLGVPGMLTVVHNYTQAQYATLMIQIAGASPDQFSVLNVLGNANLNGFVDPVLLNGFVPTIGDSFIFLNYGSLTGGFSRILHPVFNNKTEQWSVIYQDNHAILTVEAFVPDQGSTFLLLTLGLLGLVTYRQKCWQ
jgi:autotransporter-associated beta strand protein